MLTKIDFCDYDTCAALKELGYNRGAYAYYFPNHKEDLIFNTHPMRGCSINEMVKGYNTYAKDIVGYELIDAPTMWEAQKWLREIHNIFVMIDRSFAANNSWHYVICINDDFEHLIEQPSLENYSYEEALLEGIKEAVKILKEWLG